MQLQLQTLLEAQRDFERDFRGDTFHPLLMEIMDDLGLAERVLDLSLAKIEKAVGEIPGQTFTVYDYSRLKSPYPYMTMIPQARFLTFLTNEAKQFPGFDLRMNAQVHALIEEGGDVKGVRYRDADGDGEVRAQLTVGADGRSSVARRLGRFDSIEATSSIDVLWFRLTKPASDTHAGFRTIISAGALLVLFDRGDQWQVGYVIRKGDRQQVPQAGLEALKELIRAVAPEFTESVEELTEWRQISALTVKSSRVKRWYRQGLLLIGDAAHVMTPIGGVGINVAVQDAVVAANRLARPLQRKQLKLRHLASVQRRRIMPVLLVQGFQRLGQRRVAEPALNETFSQPGFNRIPILRNAITHLLAIGPWRVRVRS